MTSMLKPHLIVAYRLEDKDGNSPFYITSSHTHFPVNVYPEIGDFSYAFLNPTKFLEKEYYSFYLSEEYFLYEYLLMSCCTTDAYGAVSFRSKSVISKQKLAKGMILWQDE